MRSCSSHFSSSTKFSFLPSESIVVGHFSLLSLGLVALLRCSQNLFGSKSWLFCLKFLSWCWNLYIRSLFEFPNLSTSVLHYYENLYHPTNFFQTWRVGEEHDLSFQCSSLSANDLIHKLKECWLPKQIQKGKATQRPWSDLGGLQCVGNLSVYYSRYSSHWETWCLWDDGLIQYPGEYHLPSLASSYPLFYLLKMW